MLKNSVLRLAWLGLLLSMNAESADDFWWKAFISGAAIHTSDNQFFGDSDDSVSTSYYEAGLLLGYRFHERVRASAQVVTRDAGATSDPEPALDFAFLDFQVWRKPQNLGRIKLGRIRLPIGLFNETRDVAHTRPGIILPQSVYRDRLRGLIFSQDGIQLQWNRSLGLDELRVDATLTRATTDEEVLPELVPRGTPIRGQVDNQFDPSIRILYDFDAGRFRSALTWANYSFDFSASPLSVVPSAEVSNTAWILSLEYNALNWSLISEMTYGQVEILFDLPFIPPFELDSFGYFVQATWRYSPQWEAFARYDAEYADKDNRDSPFNFARDHTLGIAYRPDSRWLLRAEVHAVHGVSWLSNRENPSQQDLDTNWEMLMLQLAYLF